LGVLMLDLDHFKRFNDTFGHEGGDAVLQEAASLFSKNVRAEDIACRYGGEEFVLVLPNADLELTRARGEKLCAQAKLLHVVRNGRSLGEITISIGVAVFPANGSTPQELLAAADSALYQAKSEGRDRVVVAKTQSDNAEKLRAASATAT